MTPACDGVYVYTVPAASEWTTTDLLCVLHDLVSSPPTSQTEGHPADEADSASSGR